MMDLVENVSRATFLVKMSSVNNGIVAVDDPFFPEKNYMRWKKDRSRWG
jgi:hypothetical protein